MLVVGVVATSAYREERIVVMKPGEQLALAGYELTFKGVAPATGPNYREEVAVFDVTRGGAPVAQLEPSRRIYDMPPEPTTEAGIHVAWRGDLYVVLGDKQNAGGYAVRVYLQSAGALHLARRGRDVPGRRRVAVGSPLARRRAGPRPPPRRGPRRMRRRATVSHACSRLRLVAAGAALAVEPDEILPDAALEARARADLLGPALPRLPEPVDRRQQRAVGARSAPSGARAAEGRR